MKLSRFTTNDGDSLDLEIVVGALGLNSLHYGLWQEGQPLTIEEVPVAQMHYTTKLIGMLPNEAEAVLDVGAGVGDNAVYMARQGMRVTCVSPSQSQEKHFKENILSAHTRVTFVRSKYEELELDERFDVVLMSESSNYFPMDKGLDQTVRFLESGGYLVMGALFRKDNRDTFAEMHVHKEYLEAAKNRGLVLANDEDVTAQVVPTLELVHSIYKYVPPMAEVLLNFYRKSFRRKQWIISKLAALLFHREIAMARDILFEIGPRRLDPTTFRENVTYRFLAFRKD